MSGQDPDNDTHVVMGRIGAPWGVKGWVKLHSFSDPPDNLLAYRHFLISAGRHAPTEQLDTIEIDESRPHGQGFVGHIKGCDSREAAALYNSRELWLPKAALPTLEAGYYWHQLEGLRVVNLKGECFGRVHHLMETGANDVLVVRGDSDSIDREERLIPYVPEQVVRQVDLAQGLISVDWELDY